MTRRSYLYVPGDQPRMLDRAAERGADAIILDLEDAVAPSRKDDARRSVAERIDYLAGAGAQVWVRVNGDSRMLDDLRAVAQPGLAGIVLPKATATRVLGAMVAVREAEVAMGLAKDSLLLVPLIESAAGIVEARHIARCARVAHIGIGEVDLAADMGMGASPTDDEFASLRLELVLASAAAGIDPPVAPVSVDFRDLDALRASTARLKRLGFGGRAAIHPDQVAVINQVFTPTRDEVARARDLVERLDRAIAAGRGVAVDADGRMIDEATVRSARRTLAQAAAAER